MSKIERITIEFLFKRYKIKELLKYIVFSIIAFFSVLSFGQTSGNSSNNQFVVVIDPGHGGKDPGSQKHGYIEKRIALNVALEVGKKLEKNKNIKIIYTRKTDVFIPLHKRADIANKAKADLFVSIHLNAVDNLQPHGTETFVLGGAADNEKNLDIAMKENSVIYLEDDYKETYNGFDPSDPASYIGMTLMQEEYLDQSIVLADYIQKEYTNKLKRYDRGVKKAGLLVLRETYMPSVLTEIGFLTNKAEGQYLNSEKGQKEIANSIAEGITNYKKALSNYQDEIGEDFANEIQGEGLHENIRFRVQIGVGSKPLETAAHNFKGLKGVERIKEGEFYKYYYGNTNDYLSIQSLNREAKEQGFPEAFIVAFENGEKISIEKALQKKAN